MISMYNAVFRNFHLILEILFIFSRTEVKFWFILKDDITTLKKQNPLICDSKWQLDDIRMSNILIVIITNAQIMQIYTKIFVFNK